MLVFVTWNDNDLLPFWSEEVGMESKSAREDAMLLSEMCTAAQQTMERPKRLLSLVESLCGTGNLHNRGPRRQADPFQRWLEAV
jgi:hypothetical protein